MNSPVREPDAHTLCEFKVKTALGQKLEDPTKELTFFDEEMAECTDEYAQFVMECLATAKASCKDPLIMIEQRLDFPSGYPADSEQATVSSWPTIL